MNKKVKLKRLIELEVRKQLRKSTLNEESYKNNEFSDLADALWSGDKNDIEMAISNIIAKYNKQELIRIMNSRNSHHYSLYPSHFMGSPVGYPKEFAEALVKTREAEPLTDLGNVYYRNTNLTPEAEKVFAKAMDDIGPYGPNAQYNVGHEEEDWLEQQYNDGTLDIFKKSKYVKDWISLNYPQYCGC